MMLPEFIARHIARHRDQQVALENSRLRSDIVDLRADILRLSLLGADNAELRAAARRAVDVLYRITWSTGESDADAVSAREQLQRALRKATPAGPAR
ncbi:hypothetical protein [Kitasatospora sp. NPDC059571]|uniref:hypothetical protein n=1 Tax=Kitasatospora sp. NPDC059571 TaxID=3346871 RepID=UPI0036C49C3B